MLSEAPSAVCFPRHSKTPALASLGDLKSYSVARVRVGCRKLPYEETGPVGIMKVTNLQLGGFKPRPPASTHIHLHRSQRASIGVESTVGWVTLACQLPDSLPIGSANLGMARAPTKPRADVSVRTTRLGLLREPVKNAGAELLPKTYLCCDKTIGGPSLVAQACHPSCLGE